MVTAPGGVRRQVLAAFAVACLALAGAVACSSSRSSAPAPSQNTGTRGPASASASSSPVSGSSSPGQQASFARYPTAPALLTQCAIGHGVQTVRGSAEQYNASHPKSQQWLADGQVELTAANGSAFTDWFDNGGGGAVTLGGQQLSAWQQWAADHDQLPAHVCGTTISGVSARQLYVRVYAHWPSMLSNDPW